MNSTKSFFAHAATCALLALLAACGGGGGEPNATATSSPSSTQTPSLSAATEPVASNAPASAASAPDVAEVPIEVAAVAEPSSMKTIAAAGTGTGTETPADTLIVRAYGTIAGGIGPQMQVRVNGVVVGEVEVRSTEPRDYAFAVSPLKAGAKVDVAYTNDGTVNGSDRNLIVIQLLSGKTGVLPTATTATIDRGNAAAAFDGLDVMPGQSGLYANGALRLTWPQPNLTTSLVVRASGTLIQDLGPRVEVRVDGLTVGSAEVRSATAADYLFSTPALAQGSKVDVVYTNAAPGRALSVHYLIDANAVLMPTAPGVIFDAGTALAAFDRVATSPGQVAITSSGALRGTWPAANRTDRLTVRASGTAAGGIAPLLEVVQDGVILGSVNTGASPADYVFAALPLKPGMQVDLVLANPATVNGVARSLRVAYAISGSTVVKPGDGSSVQDASGLRSAWPQPNLTDRLNVRARGSLAGNVGPVMQVYVDGVMLLSQEVRNSEFVDFPVPTFPMTPGRKVDVVFANDAVINGADRNLFIEYLTTSNTFVRPSAAGNVIDRGVGAAAFDGIDTIAPVSVLAWSGAWRGTWPQANITSSVTLRASGTLAGGVGPIAQLRVNGVVVSSTEVRSETAADYVLPSPPLTQGAMVDLVFVNDAVESGNDRNLQVNYLLAGNTFVEPASTLVRYDRGTGAAAFDGLDVVAGQSSVHLNGALRMNWPAPNLTSTVVVNAKGTMAGGFGPLIQMRVNGVIVGSAYVTSTTWSDYTFSVPTLSPGARLDIVYINDGAINGQDRNLFVRYVKTGLGTFLPTAGNVTANLGSGEAAFDGVGISASTGALYADGALRFVLPAGAAVSAPSPQTQAAARLLSQATFGPTWAEVERVASIGHAAWLDEQFAIAADRSFVGYVQGKYNLGDEYRPKGGQFSVEWVAQRFWARAALSPDQLRKRVAFALHQILMISQSDATLSTHLRAYANYLDILDNNAFGNYRTLLEQVALSPAMGVYLSHIRNRREDPVTGRLPDENFAREIMQLFTIGLLELNQDGTVKTDSSGRAIETYTNQDVMALAKVFTGYGWAFPSDQLTEQNFRYSNPDYSAANDLRIDLQPMRSYPGQFSTSEKRLFAGKPHEVVIPANASADQSLKLALDTLFRHPNVAPFISRQLIQHLVVSHPSPAYVARVAAKFNNDGNGVRGNLRAVVKAILTDGEAMTPAAGSVGRLREPVLRTANWLRAFDARSISGEYLMAGELDNVMQRALFAPSVFGYYRPGYVPPNTPLALTGTTVPAMQIVNESTTASWVNTALAMAGSGIGWTGTGKDVSSSYDALVATLANGNTDALIDRLSVLLFAGRMSANLRQILLEGLCSVQGTGIEADRNRVRLAVFLALSSTEYLVQL